MSSRWKKIWADFWGNKSRTLLTVLTILVGTFGVGFISNLQLYMIESMDSDYLSANPAEARIFGYSMDDDSVKIAREVPGVDAVEGRSMSSGGQVLRPDGQAIVIQFTAVKNPEDLKVNTLQPVRNEPGLAPLLDREVLIDVSAASLGYQPGDLITVELSNGRRRELRLAGYLHDATGIPYSQSRTIDAFVTPRTIEWLGGSLDYNVLLISVAEHPNDYEHVTRIAQMVRERLERGDLTVDAIFVLQPPGHHYAYQISQGIFLVMGILGWLTVLLGGFLVVNTITALMSQQTRQIGIMKATGGNTLQIFGMYLVLILGFGLIALLIAVPLANRAAQIIGDGMAAYLGFYTTPYQGYTATLIQQIIVALVVPLLTAIVPVYNSVRVTVREALTDYGIGSSSKASKKKTVSKGSLLIPRPMRLSLRNAFRRKARLSLTLISLVLGGSIFVSVMNLWGSFYQVIEELKGYYLTDVDISFDRLYRFDKVAAMTRGVPEVESVEGWLQRTGSLIRGEDEPETQVMLLAPPSTSSLMRPILISGRWLMPGDENAIIVSNYLIDRFPQLKVGDGLTIRVDGHETEWRIVGVISVTATGGSPVLYVTYEYFSQLINQPEQVYSLRVITTSHDLETQQRVSERLEEIFTARGIGIGAVGLGAEEVQRIASLFDIFIYFFLAMAALIAVIGGVGLTSTMSINVIERTREIGVMRAIGASNWNVQSIVIVEGMVIGLISWIISVLLSIPFTVVMTAGVGQLMFRKPMTVVYGLNGIVAWLVGILVIGAIASAIPARNASHLTVKDTLAYEG